MRRPTLLGLLALCGPSAAFLLPPTPASPLTTTPSLAKAKAPAAAIISSSSSSPLGSRRRGLAFPLRGQTDDDDAVEAAAGSFFAQRGVLRPVFTALVWLGFVLYAVDFAPGMEEAARAADQKLLTDLIADPLAPSVTPLFAMVRTCQCVAMCDGWMDGWTAFVIYA